MQNFDKQQNHQVQQQGQPYQGMPPIVINNSAASSASAAAYGGPGYRRRRQSVGVHVVLFLFTMGIGNIIYAASVSSWNRRHGF
ncbi:hypothetical protein MTF65_07475 [Streptomyces sp. APSN-46.1]|uniref:hypothetical protein n=1 Tax=Streptomyces sp. APSN-46.1 TaxID=2929049 RepID=UPI001FB56B2E|nr:hypothetical protein [Streptomyces sp. APSN-46.1]MCJ1677183.1 hypothetical protein [Streptomyces sp. APSN-46.1]